MQRLNIARHLQDLHMKKLTRSILLMLMAGSMMATVGCKRGKKAGADGPLVQVPGGDESGGLLDLPEQGGPLNGEELPHFPDFANAVADAAAQAQVETVYFAHDSSVIGGEHRYKVETVGKLLLEDDGLLVSVEGHCDERGSREYNVALSDRRAMAVRDYLMVLGVGGDRINTVPHGEEFPAAAGHDESAWSQNRRAEFKMLRRR